VLLWLAATGKALAANSRSLVVGCCCCCASLACSHRLAFSSFPSLTTARWCAPRCLSASCGALALAAISRSLVVGCCCCCASLACSHRQSACNQQPLIGCRWLLLLCFSGLQPQACFLFFSIINNRSLVRASLSLCLMWCSCSCSQQPLIGCRLLLLWCCC
jgi:hypothetical protein